MEGAGHQGSQRMVVVDPMRNLPKFSCEKTESADNHLDMFDDYLEIQQINVVDANVAHVITRFGNSLFGKAKKWFKHWPTTGQIGHPRVYLPIQRLRKPNRLSHNAHNPDKLSHNTMWNTLNKRGCKSLSHQTSRAPSIKQAELH